MEGENKVNIFVTDSIVGQPLALGSRSRHSWQTQQAKVQTIGSRHLLGGHGALVIALDCNSAAAPGKG